MPLNVFYTMVQKSQKWPKTQIKGGPALSFSGIKSRCKSSWMVCLRQTDCESALVIFCQLTTCFGRIFLHLLCDKQLYWQYPMVKQQRH